jgi:ABC-2 type transport system ATP-binding protein
MQWEKGSARGARAGVNVAPAGAVGRSSICPVSRAMNFNPAPIIEVSGLTKIYRTYRKQPGFVGALKGLLWRTYEPTYAIRDVSFSVREGEFIGVLGPNGAGKTTTLKVLAGLLYPTSGKASVLGCTPWKREDVYRRQFALLLGQKNQLWWDLPARESLELNGEIYGLDRATFTRTVAELSELLSVRDKLDIMVRELSLGERMKLELITALLHQPRVLFLDEPTIGLDVVSQKVVREFLRQYNRTHRTTVLLTSHYMSDIEALCQRVIIIDHGTIFFDGSLDEVIGRFADFKLVTLQLEEHADTSHAELSPFGEVVEHTPAFVKLRVPRPRVIAVCKALLDQLPVRDIEIEEVAVEDVIRNLFAGRTPAAQRLAA